MMSTPPFPDLTSPKRQGDKRHGGGLMSNLWGLDTVDESRSLQLMPDLDRLTADEASTDPLFDNATGDFYFDLDQNFSFGDWVAEPAEQTDSQPSDPIDGSSQASVATAALSANSSLKDVGACWRCKIIRKKCHPETPCKACPSSEAGNTWHDIGCRRGSLVEHMPPLNLCTYGTAAPAQVEDPDLDLDFKLFEILLAKISRIQDEHRDKLARLLADTEYSFQKMLMEVNCPFIKSSDSPRDIMELPDDQRKILLIVWGLMENPQAKSEMHIDSLEKLANLLIISANFETDLKETSLVSLAQDSLLYCVDSLRILGVTGMFPHNTCLAGNCKVECFDNLSHSIRRYIEELSGVLLRRENLQNNRRWWLSCLYSLSIQSYVRLGLVAIDKAINICSTHSDPSIHQQQKLHFQLPVKLFAAASASYDPFASNWSLEDPPPMLRSDVGLLKHYWYAQKALGISKWTEMNISGSFAFLGLLFDLDEPACSQPELHHQGKRRREDSPPNTGSPASTNAASPAAWMSSFHRNARRAPWSHLSTASDVSVPPPLPTPMFPPATGDGATFTRRRSRNSSPASRASFDTARSPRAIQGYLTHKRSSESLLGLPENMNRCTGIHSASPTSTYSISPTTYSPRIPSSSDRLSGTSTPQRSWLNRPPLSVVGATAPGTNIAFYTCKCCPKKPKKFDTAEALSAHEAEKQYECSFCGNRFKNKNEAERHINSLHQRRHSWSCGAISGCDDAFSDSTDQPGLADVCGYCGQAFPRSGWLQGLKARFATDADWDRRIEHLEKVHRFRDCNMGKKFYRADHFRQHLKHSHAATSGTWTNVLENACLTDEEKPPNAGLI